MAINNLSGNFQPPAVDIGRSLPKPTAEESTVSTSVNKSDTHSAEVVPLNLQKEDLLGSKQVRQISENIKEEATLTQNIARRLQFQVDKDVGVTVIKVFDRETDELIRQFPPEELLNLSIRLKELNEELTSPSGILLQEKA